MTNVRKLNIPAAFDRIPKPWSPHIAASLNGQEVWIAKIKGSFEWHRHDDVDEAFMVVKGRFTMVCAPATSRWRRAT